MKTIRALLQKSISDPGIIVELPFNSWRYTDVIVHDGCLFILDGAVRPVEETQIYRQALSLQVDLEKMNWAIPLPSPPRTAQVLEFAGGGR